MTSINGHANAPASNQHQQELQQQNRAAHVFTALVNDQFPPEKIRELVAELEVPFDPSLIEWRVTNTAKGDAGRRGQVVPFADPRAYTDRLNALFTPAGWTRKYVVHTSANFQRGADERIVAKVFVTRDLTIFGVGSHSATGEEWADSENAGTSAEAQAFKRACSCFGLSRYLYYFSGVWVDLDDRKRPITKPQLVGWATPEGWRAGQRPQDGIKKLSNIANEKDANRVHDSEKLNQEERNCLIRRIEGFSEELGKGLYRGLLKNVARVWSPRGIEDVLLLQKVQPICSLQSGGCDAWNWLWISLERNR